MAAIAAAGYREVCYFERGVGSAELRRAKLEDVRPARPDRPTRPQGSF